MLYSKKVSVFLSMLSLLQCSSHSYPTSIIVDCSTLRMGQFMCPDPNFNHIDPKTQQLKNCKKNNRAAVQCIAVDGLICKETNQNIFYKELPCKWTNGYSFETTMLLSVFLGMFGADRFYLGYPAIGLAKFCTMGFMFIGQLVDIILIATHYVGPADGSHYVMPYFGPVVEIVRSDNTTFRLRQDDW